MNDNKTSEISENRIIYIYFFIILLIGILFFKLYTVSISDYTKALPSLTRQYTRSLNVTERRGFIFDRGGNILAGFEDAYNCIIDPSKIDVPIEVAAETIAQFTSFTKDEVISRLLSGKPTVMRITENINNNYMISYRTYKRHEDNSFPAIHILGYLNSENRGVNGIEYRYDDFLRDTSAKVEAVYDSDAVQKSFRGLPIRTINYGYELKSGIMLTLESKLQHRVEEIADSHLPKGAILVVSVSTGEILASVSRPTYSVNNLIDYIDSTDGEFINRAFSSFTPGSVFKTIISAAALELDIEYYEKIYICTGEIDVGGKKFSCYRRTGHGDVTMRSAYAHSCNTYYINLALETGYDKIYEMAKKFEIGEKLYLDGLYTQSGNIPETENPPPALIANIAIGQGELLITPLEAARIFCAVANNGILPDLSIVKSFIFSDSYRINALQNSGSKKILNDETVKCLLDMTRACVESGTGISAQPETGGAGGKTSSAESGQYIENIFADNTTEKSQIVHSWFAGYYPSSDVDTSRRPLYAIAVIAEGGVTFNVKSSVIFKEICDYLGIYLYN